ncbi:MAG: hypothetical protein JOZ39_01295, partial [Chloroflexi bacterium]|nr:hypothetical protein [Chloroflexota bacterium]
MNLLRIVGQRLANLHAGGVLGALIAAVVVVVSGWTDVNRFFNTQMNDTSVFMEYTTGSTYVGYEARTLPSGTRVMIDDRLTSAPDIEFLAPEVKQNAQSFKAGALPLTGTSPAAIYLSSDADADNAYLRRLYPNATFKTLVPPHGGPVLVYSALISQNDIQSIQGLNASFERSGESPVKVKVAGVDLAPDKLPVAAPFNATWSGGIAAPDYGDYGFQINGGAQVQLSIDGQAVAHDNSAVQTTLARGIHRLELKAAVDGKSAVQLMWRPPAAKGAVPVPGENLFSSPVVENGLLGHYYPNGNWTAPVAFDEVDPYVAVYFQQFPLPSPFSIEWTGQIAAPVAGAYRFNSTSIDSSQVFIDDQRVVNSGSNSPQDGQINLTAGLHDIRVRFEAHSGHNHVELRWQPPGREWSIIPSDFLFPSKAVGEAHPLPELAPAPAPSQNAAPQGQAANAAPAQPVTPLKQLWQVDGAATIGADSSPSGLAFDHDGNVFVADAGHHTLEKVDANGKLVWSAKIPAGASGFDQLAGAGVLADGSVVVLDAGSGTVSKFGADGSYVGAVAHDLGVYHPRGLAVSAQGDMFLADTGRSRVLHLDPTGKIAGEIGTKGNGKG